MVMTGDPIGVLVVDDSAVVRQVVAETLAADPAIQVLDTAADPVFARHKMERRWPDVIVLDLEMPRMDGLTFLKQIMAERPTPVVICSSLTERGAETTVEALAAGAFGVVAKPGSGVRQFFEMDGAGELLRTVKAAAEARLRRRPAMIPVAVPPKFDAGAILPPGSGPRHQTAERIVAIGASTGGTQALETVLTALPPEAPGMVIVQHMPEKFTAAFATRLDSLCRIEVREARNNDLVQRGRALIAPGGHHTLLRRRGEQYYVEVVYGPLVNRHRPSVDVLMRSVAGSAGRNALGIIMTGMGDDGARGLKELRETGARTLAQDEASCVVYGMPKEAVKLGAADKTVPLEAIAGEMVRFG